MNSFCDSQTSFYSLTLGCNSMDKSHKVHTHELIGEDDEKVMVTWRDPVPEMAVEISLTNEDLYDNIRDSIPENFWKDLHFRNAPGGDLWSGTLDEANRKVIIVRVIEEDRKIQAKYQKDKNPEREMEDG